VLLNFGLAVHDAAVVSDGCATCKGLFVTAYLRANPLAEWEAYRGPADCPDKYKDVATPLYHTYVVELSDEAGVRIRPDKPCVYVGQSARCPYVRFIQHLIDHKSAGKPRLYGVRLRPGNFRNFGPYDGAGDTKKAEADSKAAEARLAKNLRSRGYRVFGGH